MFFVCLFLLVCVAGSVRKAHPYRPSLQAMRQIRKYENSHNLVLRKFPFQRYVRKIASYATPGTQFQSTAILTLQEAAEAYLVGLMEDANRIAKMSNRETVYRKDIRLARIVRGELSVHTLK
jgi:histone H3